VTTSPPAAAPSTEPHVGRPIARVEDRRLVTGAAEYVGNIQLPRMLHASFTRSPVAHAELTAVPLADALRSPGVAAAISGEDLEGRCRPIRADTGHDSWQRSEQWPLARGRVRFVGEPIAAVAAESRYQAEDAAELVFADLDPLPAVTSIDHALEADARRVHEGWVDNCFVKRFEDSGDVDAAFAQAPRRLTVTCDMGRYSGVPMETRGCIASYDRLDGHLTLWTSHQMPHVLRTCVADLLSMPEHRIRVIAPDVGGGFGVKSNLYPEELVVCLLAMDTGRPVKWIEDRREHMLAAAQARDHRHELEVAFDDDGIVVAARAKVWVDCGAYSLFPWTAGMEPGTAISMIPGPYRIRHYRAEGYALATNKCPAGPYRGIARVPAAFTIERAMDQVAQAVGLDPFEVRRRNLVQPDEFPYLTVTGNIYDSGSYVESLDELRRISNIDELRERQRRAGAGGKRLGIGIACFVEQTGHGVQEYVRRKVPFVFGYDKALVRIDPSGTATVHVGTHNHGQGHETSFAQIASDAIGLRFEDIRLVFGDTDSAPYGNGTFGSRSTVMAGGAIMRAGAAVRDKLTEVAAFLLDREPASVEVREGQVVGPDGASLMEVAEVARVVHLRPERLPPGADPVLEAVASYDAEPGRGTYSNGACLAVVEVDLETGLVELREFFFVDDCGNVVNPRIVEGQLHGATCQGIGGALYEEFLYDDDGNPLSTTFLDYLMPSTTDVPNIVLASIETPSPFTLGGFKGTGESGTIGPPAAIAAAVEDAIACEGRVFVGRTPLTPERVLAYVDAAKGAGP
jgi:carbon-monoxide dehydrogenase large subunit